MSEIIAGMSLSNNTAALAVVEHQEHEVELLYLDEQPYAGRTGFWYIAMLDQFRESHKVKLAQVSIALDAAALTLLSCPLDMTLGQLGRNEHIHWELSHYIEKYQPSEFINDVHILKTRTQEQVQDVLAVAVHQTIIFGLQELLDKRGMTLGFVDVNHFAVDSLIRRNHPETGKTSCASIGFNDNRIDVSILQNGHMTEYRYGIVSNEGEIVSLLQPMFNRHVLEGIYLHGTHLAKEHETMLQSFTESPVTPLNPFRQMFVSPNFFAFSRFSQQPHRFTAAVGIALRKS